MTGARVFLELSDETINGLGRLYDEGDGLEANKRCHRYLREWAFKSPMPNVPGVSTMNAQVSALLQRGSTRVANRTITAEAVRKGAERFQLPDGHAPDDDVPEGAVDIIFAGKLAEVMPLCLSFTDLTMTPENRRIREWDNFEQFARLLITGKVAEDLDALDAKAVEAEENELYGDSKKKKAAKKDGPVPKAGA